MLPFLRERYGNSSMHTFGGGVKKAVDEARGLVAGLIGAERRDHLHRLRDGERQRGDPRRARRRPAETASTTRVEHPAVLALCMKIEKNGHRVSWIGVDAQGMLDLEEIRRAVRDCTGVVSVMWANNETGVVFPVEEIGKIVDPRAPVSTWTRSSGRQDPARHAPQRRRHLSLSGTSSTRPKGWGLIRKGRSSARSSSAATKMGRRGGTENVARSSGSAPRASWRRTSRGADAREDPARPAREGAPWKRPRTRA